MFYKINLQYIISYLGLIPYSLIFLDKYFFYIEEEIIFNFIVYYTLTIIVFIGSEKWNLQKKIPNHLIVYGFLPSLFAILIIILNLYSYDISKLFLYLAIFLMTQLIFDYFLIYAKSANKDAFYYVRLPLTLIITLFLLLKF